MKRHIALVVTLIVLFCGMGIIEDSAVRLRPEEPGSKSTSSVYALAGEFRVVFANLLWMKAEQYHHEYIERNGNWACNKELMGLIDLITALDPHFIEAYSAGVYIQADGYKNTRRALAYLSEGIRNNPRSWELHHLAAVLYAGRMHDPKHALPYARLAVKYCTDNFYRRSVKRLLHTIERMLAEPPSGSANQTKINTPSGPSRRPR